ncbi:MAG: hypothetical protein KY467_04530 [Gemmatimonadetes bacterium]|nr:hypothetical protein [Gemmatimonadota bacterium]
MSVVKAKYRGSTVYFHVLAELVRAAQYRGVTTYQDIALIMGLPTTGNQMSQATGQILGEIAEDEVIAGRRMLSAVAVGVSGKPGLGFYSLANQLGFIDTPDENLEFWAQERDKVYDAWRRPLPKPGSKIGGNG